MTKRDLLAQVNAEFVRLFGQDEPIPATRHPLHIRQDQIGGAPYVNPVAFPCCAEHARHESTGGFARGQTFVAEATNE